LQRSNFGIILSTLQTFLSAPSTYPFYKETLDYKGLLQNSRILNFATAPVLELPHGSMEAINEYIKCYKFKSWFW